MTNLKTTTTQMPKYRLSEILNKLPHETSKTAVNVIPTILGISKNSFYRWMRLTTESSHEIPIKRLQALAKLFECSIDDLLSENCDIPTLSEAINIYKKTSTKSGSTLVR